jgi:D-alanyl-D-alanine carboxypeptidase (penicillin-binding protein 5/6)
VLCIRAFLRTLAWLALLAISGPAFGQDLPFETTAPHAILIDAKSGNVFYEKNADDVVQPASMSKIMTMILVFEALKAGDLTLDTEFLISKNAWRRGGTSSGGSTMYAKVDTKIKLVDLMRGAMIQSANDACIAIAEGMAGSEEEFALRMTKRGKDLGLQNSLFQNATASQAGKPDERCATSNSRRYIIRIFANTIKYSEGTWNDIVQKNRNPCCCSAPTG